MTLKQLVTGLPVATDVTVDLAHIEDKEKFKDAVLAVMNTSGVSTGRGTHYNTREQEMRARLEASKALFEMDRGIFMLIHALEGVTDDARKTAIKAMLMNNWDRYANSSFSPEMEMNGIVHLTRSLQANRVLNLFNEFRKDHVNNTRTKKRLILPFLLNHPNLEWWAVKYRKKIRKALEHAWDKRTTSVIKALVNKQRTPSEETGLKDRIDRCLAPGADREKVLECISFILGNDGGFTLPLLKAFGEAKQDISRGRILPPEVLEGIRGTCHKKVSRKRILELTRDSSMTEKQKALVQRKAKKLNVTVAFNPMARSAVELYILAYAEGMTDAIRDALKKKAADGARALPVRFGKVGVLLDDSFSMTGAETQKLRPMAISLSMKDVLVNIGETAAVRTASGRTIDGRNPLPRPMGETNLSTALIDLLQKRVDVVFILSDGYENAPSGRVDEVMHLLERIGCRTPIYHMNPVAGGESKGGLRTLSEKIPVMPVGNARELSLTLLRAMIEVDVKKGIEALASMALPKLTNTKALKRKGGETKCRTRSGTSCAA